MYGITNCDTIKKARKYLDSKNISYVFHDFKKQGLSLPQVELWLQQQPIEVLINKRSTSWKQLSDEQKQALMEQTDLSILESMPTLIKRPVLETDNALLIDFKIDEYNNLIA